MSALEREIIEKVAKLDEERQLRVLEFIESIDQPEMSLAEWWKEVEAYQSMLRKKYGDHFTVDVQSLLDEVREEPTDERLGRR